MQYLFLVFWSYSVAALRMPDSIFGDVVLSSGTTYFQMHMGLRMGEF